MTQFKVALDDELFIEYFRFKNGKSQNHQLVNKLFSHLKMPFVQDNSQAMRCINSLDANIQHQVLSPALQAAFLAAGSPSKVDNELADSSIYKVMLTNDIAKVDYPYININSPKVELNYSKTCLPNEPRSELLSHLKELCSGATKVVICDKYFFNRWGNTQGQITTELFFDQVLPKNEFIIESVTFNNPAKNNKLLIEGKCAGKWEFKKYLGNRYSVNNNHDRYLLIESPHKTIEVIVTSGFDFLWNTNCEITCVFREL